LGQQTHPEVTDAVARTFEAVRSAGKPVGVNAFDPDQARKYLEAGASFVLVGADVGLMMNGARAWAQTWVQDRAHLTPDRRRAAGGEVHPVRFSRCRALAP